MITARTRTEPFLRFLDFKSRFNSQFKVSVAAILHTSRIVGGPGGNRIMQGLVADTTEPWSKDFHWTNPSADLLAALRDTTLLGLVQVHSAADDLITGVQSEIFRWTGFKNEEQPSSSENTADGTDPLENAYVCNFLGTSSDFDGIRPVLRYFRVLRNCIAHRSSIASPELQRISADPALQTAMSKWPKRQDAVPPSLPTFLANQEIELQPRHAILAVEAVYRAAVLINKGLVRRLGVDGLVYAAAHHVLGEGGAYAPSQPKNHTSAATLLSETLVNRYNLKGMRSAAVIQQLKQLGIWKKCIQQFESQRVAIHTNPTA